ERNLLDFLRCYERKAKLRGFCYAFTKALERELYRTCGANQSLALTFTICAPIRLSTVVRGVKVPAHLDTVVFKIRWLRPRRLFMFDVPAFGDMTGSCVRRSLLMRGWALAETAIERFPLTRRLALQVPCMRAYLARLLGVRRIGPTY